MKGYRRIWNLNDANHHHWKGNGRYMGEEIERRFLVLERPSFLKRLDSYEIEQWYAPDMAGLKPPKGIDLSLVHDGVRIRKMDGNWFATMKGEWNGITRVEYEWGISEIKCDDRWPYVSKTRYLWDCPDNLQWEIDIFHGKLEGLVIAEIELPVEDFSLTIPTWVDGEITGERGWSNYELACSDYFEIMNSIVNS